MKTLFLSISTKLSGLLCILICCSSMVSISCPDLGAESGKNLYDKIIALDERRLAEYDSGVARGELWPNGDLITESLALTEKLKSLAISGDAESAFCWGVLKWEEGGKLANYSPTEFWQKKARDTFNDAYLGFKIASDAGIAAASWNIAVMYEQGNGFTSSKLAAAEWYYYA